jgi:monothiol glutaredoxin
MIRLLLRSPVTRVPQKTFVGSRFLSSDSHDDFKPQKKTVIPDALEDVVKLIGKQVEENPVILYMKGTPSAPQCGFSMQAVRILNAVGADFSSVNVLEYSAVREAVKV